MGGHAGTGRTGRAAYSERLRRGEQLIPTDPIAAVAELEALAESGAPAVVRAQALALVAARLVAAGGDLDFRRAEKLLVTAGELAGSSRVANARVAHARGALALRRGEQARALEALNEAASLYPARDSRRAQVFDSLGRFFHYDVGDLGRARAYLQLSLDLKERAAKVDPSPELRRGIAITHGNLGRIELARENFEAAERNFRRDLEIVLAERHSAGDEAHVRNQLALALLGRGAEFRLDAERELERAAAGVQPGSVSHGYVLKDQGRLFRERGDLRQAEERLREAGRLADEGEYVELGFAVCTQMGHLWAARAKTPPDAATLQGLAAFDDAMAGYDRLSMYQELCEAAEGKVALLDKVGRRDEALRCLLDVAIPVAERHLFSLPQPLARFAATLESMEPIELMRLRTRRMLGGLMPAQHTGRLRSQRTRLTVWTCDIRGFSTFCEQAEPMDVIDMLNRFFAALGRPILDHGGRIDKYVGDNILAYFRDPAAAAGVALAAVERVALLNVERTHLSEPVLDIGIGLATGEVVAANVGFAGKLEHTIIGSAVNRAFRLVSAAPAGRIYVDEATHEALGRRYTCRRVPGTMLDLKGIGRVRAYQLIGRERPARGGRGA